MGESKINRLPVLFCALIDFPQNTTECSTSNTGEQTCFRCPIVGKFLVGDPVDAYMSAGRITCMVLWVLLLAVGLFGTVTNCLIISIMNNHAEKRAFDFLLTVLATFDLLSCVMSIISMSAMVSYYGMR